MVTCSSGCTQRPGLPSVSGSTPRSRLLARRSVASLTRKSAPGSRRVLGGRRSSAPLSVTTINGSRVLKNRNFQVNFSPIVSESDFTHFPHRSSLEGGVQRAAEGLDAITPRGGWRVPTARGHPADRAWLRLLANPTQSGRVLGGGGGGGFAGERRGFGSASGRRPFATTGKASSLRGLDPLPRFLRARQPGWYT
jgi:hypothetical protein